MVRSKGEQRHHRDMEELGRQNAILIQKGRAWCKHLRIEMKSWGLLAEMTGLPIGSHAVSCPHATGGSESMNLPWILPEFVIENCEGCANHEPTGDETWGNIVLQEAAQHRAAREANEKANEDKLRALRRLLEVEASQPLAGDGISRRSVLQHGIALFDQDPEHRSRASAILVEAARLAPDLFPVELIDLLTRGATDALLAFNCLPICVALAQYRADLRPRLAKLALEVITEHAAVEQASAILHHTGWPDDRQPDATIVRRLITRQCYRRPIGGWHGDEASYPNVLALLANICNARADMVLEVFRELLQSDDKHLRVDTSNVLVRLAQQVEGLVKPLAEDLLASLELADDGFDESADIAACRALARLLWDEPNWMDRRLREAIASSNGEVQELLVRVYDLAIHAVLGPGSHSVPLQPVSWPPCFPVIWAACRDFMRSENLSLDAREQAVHLFRNIIQHDPTLASANFVPLLGDLILLEGAVEAPQPRPKLVLPGMPEPDQFLQSLEKRGRQLEWYKFKREFASAVEAAAEADPPSAAETIVACYAQLDSKKDEAAKAALLALLPKLCAHDSIFPRLLPTLWQGLMDFSSVRVRASAIEAVGEAFRNSRWQPPRNVVEAMLVHLRDTYVVVHKAAANALRFGYHWFPPQHEREAHEAFACLYDLIRVYRNEPYEMEKLCHTLLGVARGAPGLRRLGLAIVAKLIPTGEYMVDEDLAEHLTREVDPGEATARLVLPAIARVLQNPTRDRMNSYEYQHRRGLFKWLADIGQDVYRAFREHIRSAAMELAKHDAWEASHFAEVFSLHADYELEAAVLDQIRLALPKEKANEAFLRELQLLSVAARATALRASGEVGRAVAEIGTLRGAGDA